MTYIQLTSGTGGWPMSVFLTPELNPFFGASYFPPEDQFGKPGFITLLTRIASLWGTDPQKIKASGENMISQLKSYIQAKPVNTQTPLDPVEVAAETYDHFVNSFDPVFGGFGSAPKFPTPVQLQFLIDYYMYNRQVASRAADAQKALDMALFTLKKIAAGGIHGNAYLMVFRYIQLIFTEFLDHVGSGFHRYSTDRKWHVPHFEKMLYDQAQLLSLYSSAYQITGEPVFADVTKDIIHYVSRDLRHNTGAFYSAQDADSSPSFDATKKLEGAFCVWEESELVNILGSFDSHVFSIHYGCKKDGNVEPAQDPQKELVNKVSLKFRINNRPLIIYVECFG